MREGKLNGYTLSRCNVTTVVWSRLREMMTYFGEEKQNLIELNLTELGIGCSVSGSYQQVDGNSTSCNRTQRERTVPRQWEGHKDAA